MKRAGVTTAAVALADKLGTPQWATTIWPIRLGRTVKLVIRAHPHYPLDQLDVPVKFMGYITAIEEDQPGQTGQNNWP